jgi:hypothetical protein
MTACGNAGRSLPSLPEADDAEAGALAQAGVANGHAAERRVPGRQFGDLQLAEPADHVRLRLPGRDAVREVLPELHFQRQHLGGAAQLQHVDRLFLLDNRDDRDGGGHFARGERDVRVGRVFAIGQHQARGGGGRQLIRLAVVVLAGDHADAVAHESRRLSGVWFDDEVRDARCREPGDESRAHRVVFHEDDVAGGARRYLPRRPHPHAGLEPRRVEQADEQEREHHQQEEDARAQHDHAENPAQIAREDDVAEAERRHHHQGPVEPRDPRVLLAFDVQLDDVEHHRVQGDEGDEETDVRGEGAQVRPLLAVRREIGDLAREELHAPNLRGRAPAEQASLHVDPSPGDAVTRR